MNRATFNKSVVPGLFAFMIDGYKKASASSDWKKICSVKTSKRAYEEAAYAAGLGIFPHKPEGEAINYDDLAQGPTKRWVHKTYALNIPGAFKSNLEMIKKAISEKIFLEDNSEGRLLCA